LKNLNKTAGSGLKFIVNGRSQGWAMSDFKLKIPVEILCALAYSVPQGGTTKAGCAFAVKINLKGFPPESPYPAPQEFSAFSASLR
jgi:hypothetical protein